MESDIIMREILLPLYTLCSLATRSKWRPDRPKNPGGTICFWLEPSSLDLSFKIEYLHITKSLPEHIFPVLYYIWTTIPSLSPCVAVVVVVVVGNFRIFWFNKTLKLFGCNAFFDAADTRGVDVDQPTQTFHGDLGFRKTNVEVYSVF